MDFLPKTHNLSLIVRQTSDRLGHSTKYLMQLRGILQNT